MQRDYDIYNKRFEDKKIRFVGIDKQMKEFTTIQNNKSTKSITLHCNNYIDLFGSEISEIRII